MTTRVRRLSVAAVVVGTGLVVLGGAFWRHWRRVPTFGFLRGQRPVSHQRYVHGRLDTYCLAGEFESVCAEIGREVSRVGCADVSPPLISNFYREFSRPGFNRIVVRVHRGISEGMSESAMTVAGQGSVTVEIGRSRPTLWEYLLDRLPDRTPASGPATGIKPQ